MALRQTLNVVAVVRSGESGATLDEICAGMNGTRVDVHVGRLKDVRPGLDIFDTLDVLLLEIDPRNADDVEALESIIRERFPRVPVVATAADATLHHVRQLMRLGVVDVVPEPITRSDLMTALEFAARARAVDNEDERRGKVISFLKAGGGVGATTIAVQAGYLLAQRFKGEKSSICLLDFDLQYGNAALYMDLDNNVGLVDLLDSPERLDGSLLRGVMGRHETGLDVLAAPRNLLGLETIDHDFVDSCLRIATREYRYVLVDLPAAWTDWTNRVLQDSDMIVLIAQLTVANVRQARRQLDALAVHGLEDSRVKALINRFEKGWGRSVPLKQAETALGRSADFRIFNDYKTVSEAANQGVPLAKIARRTKVEKSIRRFCDTVAKELAGGEVRSEPRFRIGVRR